MSLASVMLFSAAASGAATNTATVGSGREAAKARPRALAPRRKQESINVGQILRGGLTPLVAQPKRQTPWNEVFAPTEEGDLDVSKADPVFVEPATDPIRSNYVFKTELGRGSYGTVYKATEKSTGREVAIKEVRRVEGCSVLSECKIQQEVDVLDDLKDCSSVVTIHDSYQGPERIYIITELCQGGDLESYLKTNGPLNERQVALVAMEALKMLTECHSRRIVHGDVKAANFVIANRVQHHLFKNGGSMLSSGWLKGIDFGTSQYTGKGRCSNKAGTPTHWAPEIFAGSYFTEADMWSLGVALYRLMTGRLPFWDNYEESKLKHEKEILKGVIYNNPDFTGEPWNKTSAECIDFLKGLLNKNYEMRLTAESALNHPFMKKHLKKNTNFGCVFFQQVVPAPVGLSAAAPVEACPTPI